MPAMSGRAMVDPEWWGLTYAMGAAAVLAVLGGIAYLLGGNNGPWLWGMIGAGVVGVVGVSLAVRTKRWYWKVLTVIGGVAAIVSWYQFTVLRHL